MLLDDFLYEAKRRSNPYDLYRGLNAKVQQAIEVFDYHGQQETLQINNNTRKTKELEGTVKLPSIASDISLQKSSPLKYSETGTVNEYLRSVVGENFLEALKINLSTNPEGVYVRSSNSSLYIV
ncbi:hypothetical protein ACFFIX_26140 [Metabacillus herbersteinensis]|uniref:Uncharacterized protein n=1 Tax=Metabacillus herbersteinensis TaxID=283816 RepID=A0ABV6GMP5_9BACI